MYMLFAACLQACWLECLLRVARPSQDDASLPRRFHIYISLSLYIYIYTYCMIYIYICPCIICSTANTPSHNTENYQCKNTHKHSELLTQTHTHTDISTAHKNTGGYNKHTLKQQTELLTTRNII